MTVNDQRGGIPNRDIFLERGGGYLTPPPQQQSVRQDQANQPTNNSEELHEGTRHGAHIAARNVLNRDVRYIGASFAACCWRCELVELYCCCGFLVHVAARKQSDVV